MIAKERRMKRIGMAVGAVVVAAMVAGLFLAGRGRQQPPVGETPKTASDSAVVEPREDRAVASPNDEPSALPPTPSGTITPFERPAGRALMTLGTREVEPQRFGTRFERLLAQPHQQIPVTMHWPRHDSSEDVLVHAIHGGRIDGGGNAKRFALGADKTVEFVVELGNAPGLYEVLLRRGTYEEVLEFWVPLGVAAIDRVAVNHSGGDQ
jgi:hypothetical protein